jgi:hypothetical protein
MPEVARPHPSRCDPARADYAEIIAAHEAAVHRGESTYMDPASGLAVMTVTALVERGTCCASGCRHCPYV